MIGNPPINHLLGPSRPITIDLARYAKLATLTDAESHLLKRYVARWERGGHGCRWLPDERLGLQALLTPIRDVLDAIGPTRTWEHSAVIHCLAQAMVQLDQSFWGWSREQWHQLLQDAGATYRPPCMAVAYLLCGYRDLHLDFPRMNRLRFAAHLLSRTAIDTAVARVEAVLARWSYAADAHYNVQQALCDMALVAGSAELEVIAGTFSLKDIEHHHNPRVARSARLVLRVLATLCLREDDPALEGGGASVKGLSYGTADVLPEWLGWIGRWCETSALSPRTRAGYFRLLLKAGRWMTVHHPEASSPGAWTRTLAAEYVAAVDRMTLGEWAHLPPTRRVRENVGRPLQAPSKAGHLVAMRTFFRDAQEWGWIPVRFDPGRAFRTPRAVSALIGPDPRVIGDDVWAKLLWAGINLKPSDLPSHGWKRRGSWHPFEMVKAIAMIWLFAGLRVNEIVRLRHGCIRWQAEPGVAPGPGGTQPEGAICLLDVPVHKTGAAFTKPVDRLVGEAINAWEAVRPDHPALIDYKTGQAVDLLFAHRGCRLSRAYVNRVLIPLLSAKANVPDADARGRITSHRARSTIATQLYNAKDPMTLFELQAWLGHRSPTTTQFYARITPVTLARAYSDAGYFARNLRTIEVLIDRDAVISGAAAEGQPWQYYDLGHGFCTYNFFEQCPHRMACARCDFYVPKPSSRAQLLEARGTLQRMRAAIPLTDDELAAVDGDAAAVERLIAKLEDVPTPAGPTPGHLRLRPLPMAVPASVTVPTDLIHESSTARQKAGSLETPADAPQPSALPARGGLPGGR